MKTLTSLLPILCCLTGQAQDDLIFNKRFVECEDQWVAFTKTKDSTYPYGFIYIDAMAGLTFHHEGNFIIGEDGKLIPKKLMDNGMYKVRLEPNNVKVAILPSERLTELNAPNPPDWLKNYKNTKDSVARMVRWGYYYNHWGESAKALTYLEKAYELDPEKEGVEFELSYAYNALKRFEKAVPVLARAVSRDPGNCLLYKELSYALVYKGDLEAAGDICLKGAEHCTEDPMKAEIMYNLMYGYYKKGDKKNFERWKKEMLKYTTDGDIFSGEAEKMSKNLKN